MGEIIRAPQIVYGMDERVVAETERKVNILLVDDRPENRLVLKATLAPLNQNIIEAGSGREALKYLLEQDFAVILLDVMMPELDGFETARLIREREKSRSTPIIFVSAMFLGDADAFRGYSVGAVDYLMKPFVPEIVRSKVAVFVDLFRKTEEIKRQAELIRSIEQREYQSKLVETTQRMQAETDRVRAEHRAVRAMVQHAPMGFARLTPQQIVTDINPVFIEQYHLREGNVIGRRLTDLVTWLPPQFVTALDKNEPFHFYQLTMLDDEGVGNERYCDLAMWPVVNPNGTQNGTILLSVDVSERVRLDQQRKDFVATLAHDLQTPVIASDRALSLLLDRVTKTMEPDFINLVSMLKKNNENLLHMIVSLLDLYHYEEGARSLYFDDVDLRLLVTTCVEELLPLADQQGLTLTSRLPRRSVVAQADRTALRRVLTNLLDNAIKFTPRGGSIEVGLAQRGDWVVLEVSDTGLGISDDDQKRLFDRYWHGRGHKTYKASKGLGLYLCRQIVDAHHGRIECHSELGKLTSFKVHLPIHQSVVDNVSETAHSANLEAS